MGIMATEMGDALPTALDCRKKSAEMEAEKASECMRKRAAAEAEKNCISHILSSIPYKNVKGRRSTCLAVRTRAHTMIRRA